MKYLNMVERLGNRMIYSRIKGFRDESTFTFTINTFECRHTAMQGFVSICYLPLPTGLSILFLRVEERCHVVMPIDGMQKVLFRRLLPRFAPSLFQKANTMPPNLELYGDHRNLEISNELNKKILLLYKKKSCLRPLK